MISTVVTENNFSSRDRRRHRLRPLRLLHSNAIKPVVGPGATFSRKNFDLDRRRRTGSLGSSCTTEAYGFRYAGVRLRATRKPNSTSG